MKKSIVVFAVAAAFAGSVAAQQLTESCRSAVGWWTIGTDTGPTGATQTTSTNSGEFGLKAGTKIVSCTVPKNKGISFTFNQKMSQDECSVYNALASSDSKLSVGKLLDASSQLGILYTKLNTLAGDGKLTSTGAANIGAAVIAAQSCVDTLMSQ